MLHLRRDVSDAAVPQGIGAVDDLRILRTLWPVGLFISDVDEIPPALNPVVFLMFIIGSPT